MNTDYKKDYLTIEKNTGGTELDGIGSKHYVRKTIK